MPHELSPNTPPARVINRQIMRGHMTREAVVRLKCTTQMTMQEIADHLDKSHVYCSQIWSEACKEARAMRDDPAKQEELRAWLAMQVQMVISKAQNRIEDNAAYGALVLKGSEQLADMMGLSAQEAMGDKYDYKELAERVESKSPLVLAKLNKVKDEATADKIAKELE